MLRVITGASKCTGRSMLKNLRAGGRVVEMNTHWVGAYRERKLD